MNRNIVYYETITPWAVILSFAVAMIAMATAFVYLIGMQFVTHLVMVTALVLICVVFSMYWRFTIQIDDTTIAFGYHFTGKEQILLSTIAYAEKFIVDRKSPAMRLALNAAGPPVLGEGRWLPGAMLIRLRLNEDYLTRYKLKQKKKVKQVVLASRNPEKVLSLLSENGVLIQQR